MKRIIFILIALNILMSAYSQVDVSFQQNMANSKSYLVIKIANTSGKCIRISNVNKFSTNGSQVNFSIYNNLDSKLSEIQFVLGNTNHFIMKIGETKTFEYSRDQIIGYCSSSSTIKTFNVELHLEYTLLDIYPTVSEIQVEKVDLKKSFIFY